MKRKEEWKEKQRVKLHGCKVGFDGAFGFGRPVHFP